MSLIIKGVDMPKSGESMTYSSKEIIEIPRPHGRLIDADELYEQFINEFCNRNCDESVRGEICDRCGVLRAINMIKSAPTIIEAENSSAIDDDVKKYCDYLKSETYDFCNRIENGEVNEG